MNLKFFSPINNLNRLLTLILLPIFVICISIGNYGKKKCSLVRLIKPEKVNSNFYRKYSLYKKNLAKFAPVKSISSKKINSLSNSDILIFFQSDSLMNNEYYLKYANDLAMLNKLNASNIIAVIEDVNIDFLLELINLYNDAVNLVVVPSKLIANILLTNGLKTKIHITDIDSDSFKKIGIVNKEIFVFTLFVNQNEYSYLLEFIKEFKDFFFDKKALLRINIQNVFNSKLDDIFKYIKEENIKNILITESFLTTRNFESIIRNTDCLISFSENHSFNCMFFGDYFINTTKLFCAKNSESIKEYHQNLKVVSRDKLIQSMLNIFESKLDNLEKNKFIQSPSINKFSSKKIKEEFFKIINAIPIEKI